jgi:hypothetical protein
VGVALLQNSIHTLDSKLETKEEENDRE